MGKHVVARSRRGARVLLPTAAVVALSGALAASPFGVGAALAEDPTAEPTSDRTGDTVQTVSTPTDGGDDWGDDGWGGDGHDDDDHDDDDHDGSGGDGDGRDGDSDGIASPAPAPEPAAAAPAAAPEPAPAEPAEPAESAESAELAAAPAAPAAPAAKQFPSASATVLNDLSGTALEKASAAGAASTAQNDVSEPNSNEVAAVVGTGIALASIGGFAALLAAGRARRVGGIG